MGFAQGIMVMSDSYLWLLGNIHMSLHDVTCKHVHSYQFKFVCQWKRTQKIHFN